MPVADISRRLDVHDVHGAAAAAAKPVSLPASSAISRFGIGAAGEEMSVRAVRAVEVVALAQRGGDADGDAFLADADMHEPAQLLPMAQLDHALFEAADEPHPLQHVPQQGIGLSAMAVLTPGHEGGQVEQAAALAALHAPVGNALAEEEQRAGREEAGPIGAAMDQFAKVGHRLGVFVERARA